MNEGEIEVGHLIVVAGPTAVGKTTFTTKLLEDKYLQSQLGMQLDGCSEAQAHKWHKLQPGIHDQLLLQYGFMRVKKHENMFFHDDLVLKFFDKVERLTIITLVASIHQLEVNLQKREIEARNWRPGKHCHKLIEYYGKQNFLEAIYHEWDVCCNNWPASKRFYVENCGEFRLLANSHWEDVLDC